MFNTIVIFACICYESVCIWRIKYYYYYYYQIISNSRSTYFTASNSQRTLMSMLTVLVKTIVNTNSNYFGNKVSPIPIPVLLFESITNTNTFVTILLGRLT